MNYAGSFWGPGTGRMIRKIVFATDLGPFAGHALEHALDLAANIKSKVTVVHAVEPLSSYAQAMVSAYAELEALDPHGSVLKSIKHQILTSLASERSDLKPGYDWIEDVVVEQGKPAEVILSQAQRLNADLIVMGSHGPESMGKNVIGSVTSRVLQLSKVPVFMVPMISPSNWCRVASEVVR
ncbi:universal stress protein [Pseudomaricurvus hydrocarbonicus]